MKIKNIFGSILFITLFVALSIIIFGKTDQYVFPFIYFILALITISIIIFALRPIYEKKTDWAIFIILGLILVVSMTYCFSNLKSSYETNKETQNSKALLANELNNIASMNDYYQKYVTYELEQIEISKNNSQTIQNQINQALIGTNPSNTQLLTLQNQIKQYNQALTEAYADIETLQQQLVEEQNKPPVYIYVRGDYD